MEVAPGVHLVQKVIGNVYIITEPDGLTMIDTGLPGSSGKITGQIHSLGRQSSELRQILITHADMDHVGSLEDLRQRTSASVLASKGEAEAIRAGRPSRELNVKGVRKAIMSIAQQIFRPKPGRVDTILNPDDELPILGGLIVIPTPGHTPDHISFWSPSTGILFSGDSIVIRDGKFRPSHGMNNWNVELSQESFDKQAALHPTCVFGGHGWAVDVTGDQFWGRSTGGS